MTLVLGIETSCDETAAAVIADGREIRSNVVASQVDLHRQYGGVFPEIASRQHMIAITPTIEQAMAGALVTWDDLAAIAVTYGPGLSGSLLVGVNVAKGLAYGRGLPLIGVNHIEAHIATNWLDVAAQDAPQEAREPAGTAFPILCLVVSGGHTELILMQDYGTYHRLGSTIDDAAGEAFDKVARMLNLDYPGGPAIDRASERGNRAAFSFPRARPEHSYDFSFSGLKTAVLRVVHRYAVSFGSPQVGDGEAYMTQLPPGVPEQVVANLAASFQEAVVDVLVEKTCQAAAEYRACEVLMAGGVAANRSLRREMRAALAIPLRMPPVALSTDNATGVGVAGTWALRQGHVAGWDLDVVPRLKLGTPLDRAGDARRPG